MWRPKIHYIFAKFYISYIKVIRNACRYYSHTKKDDCDVCTGHDESDFKAILLILAENVNLFDFSNEKGLLPHSSIQRKCIVLNTGDHKLTISLLRYLAKPGSTCYLIILSNTNKNEKKDVSPKWNSTPLRKIIHYIHLYKLRLSNNHS